MNTEEVVGAVSTSARSEISLRACRTHSRRAVYVDENFVSLGVVERASASSTVASQRVTPDVHRSCIYKPCEMERNVVCLRYLLVGSFILLGISGAVVCGTGSYFLHQLHGSLTSPQWYGSPALLLTTGIVNVILGPYFWHYFDTKYNQPQLFMFLILVVLVAIIQAGAGIWALVSHAAVDSSISEMLHEKLASIGKIEEKPAWNLTEIKVNCCGYEESSVENDENNEITWSCCSARRYNANIDEIDTCVVFYMNECHHLALHRYRSILFHSFVLALCAFLFQVYLMTCIKSYLRALKKSMKTRRARSVIAQSLVDQHPQMKTCSSVPVGPQHVCEGCASAPYQ